MKNYLQYPTSKSIRVWYKNPTERVMIKKRMAKGLHEQDEIYRMNVESEWPPEQQGSKWKGDK